MRAAKATRSRIIEPRSKPVRPTTLQDFSPVGIISPTVTILLLLNPFLLNANCLSPLKYASKPKLLTIRALQASDRSGKWNSNPFDSQRFLGGSKKLGFAFIG